MSSATIKLALVIVQYLHSAWSDYERSQHRARLAAIRADPVAEWNRRFGTQRVPVPAANATAELSTRAADAAPVTGRSDGHLVGPRRREPADLPGSDRPVFRVSPVIREAEDGSRVVPICDPPCRATSGAGGYDLHANENVTIAPGAQVRISTGWRVAIPAGWVGLVWPRSGLTIKHRLDRRAGVIDMDYRGELSVVLVNESTAPQIITFNDRIAQMVIVPYLDAPTEIVPELDDTVRNTGGFGSTGRGK